MTITKQCKRCLKTKPIQDFKLMFGRGYTATCNGCLDEKTRARKKAELREKAPIEVSYQYLKTGE